MTFRVIVGIIFCLYVFAWENVPHHPEMSATDNFLDDEVRLKSTSPVETKVPSRLQPLRTKVNRINAN